MPPGSQTLLDHPLAGESHSLYESAAARAQRIERFPRILSPLRAGDDGAEALVVELALVRGFGEEIAGSRAESLEIDREPLEYLLL